MLKCLTAIKLKQKIGAWVPCNAKKSRTIIFVWSQCSFSARRPSIITQIIPDNLARLNAKWRNSNVCHFNIYIYIGIYIQFEQYREMMTKSDARSRLPLKRMNEEKRKRKKEREKEREQHPFFTPTTQRIVARRLPMHTYRKKENKIEHIRWLGKKGSRCAHPPETTSKAWC